MPCSPLASFLIINNACCLDMFYNQIFVIKGTKYFFLQFSVGLWLDCPGEEWSGLGLVESLDKGIISLMTPPWTSSCPDCQCNPAAGAQATEREYLNACLGSDALPRFSADLQIYLEACKLAHHSAGTVTFLITQD